MKIQRMVLALSLSLGGAFAATADVSAFDPRIAAPRTTVDVEGLDWIDGKDLPLESQGYTNAITRYGRLPADMVDKLPQGLRQMQAHATGHYFLLSTDSPDLVFAWTLAEKEGRDPFIPPQGMYGVDVYRYVEDAAAAGVRSLTKGGWVFVANGRLGKEAEERMRVPLRGQGMKGVLIYLPTRGVVRSCRIGVRKGSKVERWCHKSGVAKPVVHYGTSIVHGGCASRPGLCFTSQAGRLADVPYVNLGFSGGARLELGVADVVARAPASLYVVDPVWNCSVQIIEERCEPFLRRLHELRPETPILLCEGGEPAGRLPQNDALKRVYGRLAAENSPLAARLSYLPAEGLLPRDGESTHDYCHPNDYGSMSMGMAFARRIREVLKLD